jgi:hypothetical protein
LPEHHAATPTVISSESIKNAVMPQEIATNSQDAKELPLLDSVDQQFSRDQTPDASSQEPPRENVTEAVSANKRKSWSDMIRSKKDSVPCFFLLISFVFPLHFIKI